MRSVPFLLGLGLVLGACGPSGAWNPLEAEGETAVVVARVRGKTVARALPGEPLSVRVDPDATWSAARSIGSVTGSSNQPSVE